MRQSRHDLLQDFSPQYQCSIHLTTNKKPLFGYWVKYEIYKARIPVWEERTKILNDYIQLRPNIFSWLCRLCDVAWSLFFPFFMHFISRLYD